MFIKPLTLRVSCTTPLMKLFPVKYQQNVITSSLSKFHFFNYDATQLNLFKLQNVCLSATRNLIKPPFDLLSLDYRKSHTNACSAKLKRSFQLKHTLCVFHESHYCSCRNLPKAYLAKTKTLYVSDTE